MASRRNYPQLFLNFFILIVCLMWSNHNETVQPCQIVTRLLLHEANVSRALKSPKIICYSILWCGYFLFAFKAKKWKSFVKEFMCYYWLLCFLEPYTVIKIDKPVSRNHISCISHRLKTSIVFNNIKQTKTYLVIFNVKKITYM